MKNWEDIFAYLNKEISSEEKESIDAWRKTDNENEVYFQKVKKVYENTSGKDVSTFKPNTDIAWANLKSEMDASKAKAYPFKSWTSIAAAVALILLGTWAASTFVFNGLEKVELAKGEETKEILLEDGSTIWLRAGSSITYPSHFEDSMRWVKLEGEAFFDIEKDPAKPFVVQTQHSQTTVLGTSFNVKSNDKGGDVEVALFTGKVKFEAGGQQTELLPGEKATFQKSLTKLEKGSILTQNITAWKTKELKFTDTPFAEVINTLEDYYQVEFEVTNKDILHCGFTSNFKNAALEEVLQVLIATGNLSVTQNGQKILFDGNGCTEENPI